MYIEDIGARAITLAIEIARNMVSRDIILYHSVTNRKFCQGGELYNIT